MEAELKTESNFCGGKSAAGSNTLLQHVMAVVERHFPQQTAAICDVTKTGMNKGMLRCAKKSRLARLVALSYHLSALIDADRKGQSGDNKSMAGRHHSDGNVRRRRTDGESSEKQCQSKEP
jgi:hypothetical protein